MIGPNLGAAAYLVLLLLVIGGFLVVEMRTRPGATLRMMLTWVLIFMAALAIAGLWPQLRQAVAPQAMKIGDRRLEVPIARDGHAYLTAQVNGTDVLFVVDTGASVVALTRRDAQKVGLDPDRLAYYGIAQTANGRVQTAPVVLKSIRIGDFSSRNVAGMVIDGDVGVSLLGMAYLRRFGRVSFESDRLIMEW